MTYKYENLRENSRSPEHYYPVMGDTFKDADKTIEIVRPKSFRSEPGEQNKNYKANMDILLHLNLENVGDIKDVRKTELHTKEVDVAAVDMLEDAVRLAATRLTHIELSTFNKMGGLTNQRGEKIDEAENFKIFVEHMQKLRGAVQEVASNDAQRKNENTDLNMFAKVEIIARSIEGGRTSSAKEPAIDANRHGEKEQLAKEAMAKQLRALAVKEIADRMVERYTEDTVTKDLKWGMEVQMDKLMIQLEKPGITAETQQTAMEVLRVFNEQEFDGEKKTKYSIETSVLAKRVMRERTHAGMEQGAASENFRAHLNEHLGKGQTLVELRKDQTFIEIVPGDALTRTTTPESKVIGREDIGTIGTATIAKNIEEGFMYAQLQKGTLKIEQEGFNRSFYAAVENELKKDSPELAANTAMIHGLEIMANNFNAALATEMGKSTIMPGDNLVTKEEVVRIAALLIGRRALLKTNPNMDLDARLSVFAVPETAQDKAAELTSDLARSLEFFDQKLLQAQQAAEVSDELKYELSYGFIALAQSLQNCDKKWQIKEPKETVEITVFPAIIGTDEIYNEKDPLEKPVKKDGAQQKKK